MFAQCTFFAVFKGYKTRRNESTAGADTSVGVSKLHKAQIS